MHRDDFKGFAQMLDDVAGLKREVYTAGQKAMFFRALQAYSFEAVRSGLDAHVRDPDRGRFLPMPADVIAQIVGHAANDGRPGAEEAWAIASQASDEGATVVWTEEIAQAWGISRSVAATGDDIGARMAFKEAYQRLVREARERGISASWSPTFGHDSERRQIALQAAATAGRIEASLAIECQRQEVPLLAFTASEGDSQAKREAVAALQALRDRMSRPYDGPSEADLQRERTERQKAKAAALYRFAKIGEQDA